MQVLQHLTELTDPDHNRLFGEAVIQIKIILHIMPRDVIHNRIYTRSYRKEIVHLRQISVVQLLQDIGLCTHIDAPCKIVLDSLYDYLLLKSQVVAQINDSCTALSNFPDHLVHSVDNVSVLKHMSMCKASCLNISIQTALLSFLPSGILCSVMHSDPRLFSFS